MSTITSKNLAVALLEPDFAVKEEVGQQGIHHYHNWKVERYATHETRLGPNHWLNEGRQNETNYNCNEHNPNKQRAGCSIARGKGCLTVVTGYLRVLGNIVNLGECQLLLTRWAYKHLW